jgi:hypothetical protein
LGTLNFHWLVSQPAPQTSMSPSETVQVEVPWVAYAEEMAPGAPVREKMVEALALIGAACANMSLGIDSNCVNGVEPRPEDAPGWAPLTPGTLKGSGFNASWEAPLDDVTSVLGSFDIVDLGIREPGLSGYPRAPLLPASWGQVAGGAELTCSWVMTVP